MWGGRAWRWASVAILGLIGAGLLQAQAPAPGTLWQDPPPPGAALPAGFPSPCAVGNDHGPEDHGWERGIYATGDYLLLRAYRTAADFAVVSPQLTDTAIGSIESAGWDTRSGFRLGAGYQLPDDAWRLGVTYTYFYTAGTSSVQAPAGGQLFATLTRGGSIDDVASASAFSSLHYNVLDIDITRLWCPSKAFDLQFFGGARVAWIDQKLSAVYNGGSAVATDATVSSPVYFTGAGLTAGARGFWRIWNDLGIYGGGRFSLLSGRFRNFVSETNDDRAVTIVNVHEQYREAVPVAELSAGVAWQSDHLRLSAGYELANWFHMVDSPDFATGLNIGKVSRRTSDLTLEGLAIELAFLF